MAERLVLVLILMVAMVMAESDDDTTAEERGYADYDAWNPAAKPSTPDVILIKQKEPSWSSHHHSPSLGSILKDNLHLLAVLAPLAAAAVLFPLKAYLLPNYVVYPPVTAAPPAAPPARRDRLGKEDSVAETQTLAAQILNMIDDMEKVYGDKGSKKKNS